MLQMRLENTTHGTIFVLGLMEEDLDKLHNEKAAMLTELAEPCGPGLVLVMQAQSHEEMEANIRATDLFTIEGVVDARVDGPRIEIPQINATRNPFLNR